MNQRSPVFLEERTYRLRRLRDAARLLPILGLFLMLLPLLWGGSTTRLVAIYLFVVWFVLILLAGIVELLMRRHEDPQEENEKE